MGAGNGGPADPCVQTEPGKFSLSAEPRAAKGPEVSSHQTLKKYFSPTLAFSKINFKLNFI